MVEGEMFVGLWSCWYLSTFAMTLSEVLRVKFTFSMSALGDWTYVIKC